MSATFKWSIQPGLDYFHSFILTRWPLFYLSKKAKLMSYQAVRLLAQTRINKWVFLICYSQFTINIISISFLVIRWQAFITHGPLARNLKIVQYNGSFEPFTAPAIDSNVQTSWNFNYSLGIVNKIIVIMGDGHLI